MNNLHQTIRKPLNFVFSYLRLLYVGLWSEGPVSQSKTSQSLRYDSKQGVDSFICISTLNFWTVWGRDGSSLQMNLAQYLYIHNFFSFIIAFSSYLFNTASLTSKYLFQGRCVKAKDDTILILTNFKTIFSSSIQVFKLSDVNQTPNLIAANSIHDQPLSCMIYKKATMTIRMILNNLRILLLKYHSSTSRWTQVYV